MYNIGYRMLNEEQKKFYNIVSDAIDSEHKDFRICLNAMGGSGKTFTIKQLAKKYGEGLQLLAPTHKACSLFHREGLKSFTLHRFFKSKVEYKSDTGDMFFVLSTPNDKKYNEEIKAIVVDECSMVDSEIYKSLTMLNKPIIFTGDKYQINPVGEDISPVFDEKNNCVKFTFNQNMRIKKNPDSLSASYLKKFRNAVDTHAKIRVDRMSNDFMFENFEKDNSDCIVLAWSNKQVGYWNYQIRKRLFRKQIIKDGGDLKPFYIGERLVYTGYRPTETEPYHTSDIITIRDIDEMSLFIPFKKCMCYDDANKIIPCIKHNIKGHNSKGYNIDFYRITDHKGYYWLQSKPSSKNKMDQIIREYKNYCKQVKNSNEWKGFYSFKNLYDADLKYNYAMTVHKAQGSQFHTVFVDINNIRLNRKQDECSRLAYTAVSRFTDFVYFI